MVLLAISRGLAVSLEKGTALLHGPSLPPLLKAFAFRRAPRRLSIQQGLARLIIPFLLVHQPIVFILTSPSTRFTVLNNFKPRRLREVSTGRLP